MAQFYSKQDQKPRPFAALADFPRTSDRIFRISIATKDNKGQPNITDENPKGIIQPLIEDYYSAQLSGRSTDIIAQICSAIERFGARTIIIENDGGFVRNQMVDAPDLMAFLRASPWSAKLIEHIKGIYPSVRFGAWCGGINRPCRDDQYGVGAFADLTVRSREHIVMPAIQTKVNEGFDEIWFDYANKAEREQMYQLHDRCRTEWPRHVFGFETGVKDFDIARRAPQWCVVDPYGIDPAKDKSGRPNMGDLPALIAERTEVPGAQWVFQTGGGANWKLEHLRELERHADRTGSSVCLMANHASQVGLT